jgi:enamine deaminase RidA (YjgF/YER057c/UK114 family)
MFLAGQVSLDAGGNMVGEGDAAAQTRQIFENLGAVLASAGASFSNVLEVVIYVVGREAAEANRQARAELYPALFPNGDYPAATLLIVDGLAREEFLVEIKAVAALP